jgi:glutamate synthase domain-containing protein 2
LRARRGRPACYNILIVSDRTIASDRMAIPALLATAAVHQHLVRKGLRTSTGLVVETGSAREVHQFALLLAGYGVEAVHPCPRIAAELHEYVPQVAPEESAKRFVKAICRTLQGDVQMGISTYQSYCGAQIFEAVASTRRSSTSTSPEPRATSRARTAEVAAEAARLPSSVFGDDPLLKDALDAGGSTSIARVVKTTCGRRQ